MTIEHHTTPAALKKAIRKARVNGRVNYYAEVQGRDDVVVVNCTIEEMLRYLDETYNGGWEVMECQYESRVDSSPYTCFTLTANNS